MVPSARDGEGNDYLSCTGSAAAVTVNLSSATVGGGDAQGDTASGFEKVLGSEHDDVITGDDADNILTGNGGSDTYTGGAGTDTFDFKVASGTSVTIFDYTLAATQDDSETIRLCNASGNDPRTSDGNGECSCHDPPGIDLAIPTRQNIVTTPTRTGTMKIRPEAREIMIAFGSPSTEIGAQPREVAVSLIDSLADFDSVAWQPLPLTALAQAYANAQAVPADPPFSVPDTIVNYLADTPPAPLASELRAPLLDAVDHASESYFTAARNDFKRGNTVSGTENLCYAANCAVIGQAALHGWPHATEDDDTNAVVALATGTLPQNADELYNLLQQAPKDGMDLSSNHGAVKSVHQAARLGYFAENGYTAELATSFAQAATELAKRLGSDAS